MTTGPGTRRRLRARTGARAALRSAGTWALSLVAAVAFTLGGCSSSKNLPGAADSERQSEAEYDIAKDLFVNRRQPRAALGHALRALELNDDNTDAQHLTALIYLYFCATSAEECRLDEAERYARQAVEGREDFREARNTLGVVLIHEKRYADAIQVLEPLAHDMLYATPETAWGNLGWAYLHAGQLDKAVDALRRSVALQPDFCVGSYRLGLAYERQGAFEAAREAFSRAVETDRPECKGLQDAFEARARVALRLGDRDGARGDLQRCRDLGTQSEAGRQCAATLAKMQ